ncbi:ATP-binding protein [Streptomyces cinereospinus]|uniref:histidine kinase n=1 Tax=Streptomyces cinereospinus TaxID=285561 RepID=A0ABV5N6P7_9ACTN
MSTNGVGAPSAGRPASPGPGEPARPAPPPARGGLRGFADRRPFRQKLNVLVGVPLAGLGVLLTYLISGQVSQARSAAEAAALVRDSAQVAELVDRVETEHQQAILLSVRHEADGSGATPSLSAYRAAQRETDAQVEKVRAAFGDRLPRTEAQALREVNGLGSLRRTVEGGYLPADNIDPAYHNAAQGLIDGLGLDRNAALAATFTGNLLDSLLRADAAHGSFETSVFSATTGDSNALIEFIGAVGAHELWEHQAERFGRFATEEQAAELRGIEHNPAQATILRHYAELQIDPSSLQAATPAVIRAKVSLALSGYPTYGRQSETRLAITGSLIGQIADRADDASDDAWWNAAWLLVLAVSGFLLWGAVSVVVRRSVVRPVQALTGAARQVADVAGRELARVADDDTEDDAPPRLREVPVTARDEIGDLADAFNQVQTTAAALLERQVLSRRNVAEMFGNVGRRVSNLTTRQLALIDAVERGETDPALLESLYSIDHIAVRLRRNADSLMLLAGIRESVLDAGPTALTTVVRAALGQIEGYQRVQLHAGSQVMVEPDAVGDLTLMVAELLENAVSFSPEGSPVEVTVQAAAEGTTITVADHGLGMSAERLAEENARLIRRERLDLVPTKVLGLFVVGNLARRWKIGVTLTRTPGGGVTAEIAVPAALLPATGAVAPGGTTASGTTAEAAPGRAAPGGTRADAAASRTAPAPPSGTAVHRTTAVPPPGGTAPGRTAAEAASGDGGPGSGPAGRRSGPPPPTSVPGGPADPVDAAAGPPRGRYGTAADGLGPLPRRVPRRGAAAGDAGSPRIPRARSAAEPASGSRPLRRRVRGATLRTTAGAEGEHPAARQAAAPADAEAVRDALEEFEAAVERAHRDTAADRARAPDGPRTGTAPDRAHPADGDGPRTAHDSDPHDPQHLPEGAEQ